MTKKMLSVNSASSLADYVSEVDTESKKMIDLALEALSKELEAQQQLIYQALLQYRGQLIDEPSDEEFYDLVTFIDKFTANFNENRIDVSIISNDQLTAWQNRNGVPQKSVRRNVMILLIDAAAEGGLLSGVGFLNDWLSFASDSELYGNWLLASCGLSPKVSTGTELGGGDRFELLYRPLDSFESFELSVRAANGLKNNHIYYIGDLVSRTEKQLMRLQNMGKVLVAEIKAVFDSLNTGLALGCLTQEEQLEFDNRRWLNENAGSELRLSLVYDNWSAPADLVEQLKLLGITQMTQLATCPEAILAPLMSYRDQMEKMLASYSYVKEKLAMSVPRYLNGDVKVYIKPAREELHTTTE